MFQRSRGCFGDCFGQSGGPAVRHDHSARPRRVRGANNGAQIVRIFHAVQDDQQSRIGQHLIQLRITVRGAKRHHALMRRAIGCPIQRLARFKAQRDRAFPRQIDDFLQPGSAGAARDQHAIERAARAQSLANRMNSGDHVASTGLRVIRLARAIFSGLNFGRSIAGWMFRSL